MIGLLIISHEPLGTALLHCTRHIYARLPPQVAALDVIPDEDPQAAFDAARELAGRINDGSGVLVLTDLLGATPARVAERLVEPFRIELVAGVNLPMLCRALTYRRRPLEELVPLLIDGGRGAIQVVPPAAPNGADACPQPKR